MLTFTNVVQFQSKCETFSTCRFHLPNPISPGIFHLAEPVVAPENKLFANARPRHKKDVAAIATANQNGSVSADSVKSSCEELRVDVKNDLLCLTSRRLTVWVLCGSTKGFLTSFLSASFTSRTALPPLLQWNNPLAVELWGMFFNGPTGCSASMPGETWMERSLTTLSEDVAVDDDIEIFSGGLGAIYLALLRRGPPLSSPVLRMSSPPRLIGPPT